MKKIVIDILKENWPGYMFILLIILVGILTIPFLPTINALEEYKASPEHFCNNIPISELTLVQIKDCEWYLNNKLESKEIVSN
jgi:hypothetical protein